MTIAEPARTRSVRDLRRHTLSLAAQLDGLGWLDPAVPASVRENVAEPTAALQDAVRAMASYRYPLDEIQQLRELAVEAMELNEEWERHLRDAPVRTRDLMAVCLTQLRSCRDKSEVGNQVCPAAARAFGVQRALVARIHAGAWSPWAVYDAASPSLGREDPNRPGVVPLADLPTEGEVVRTGRVLTSAWGTVWPEITRVLVAPVPVAGRVTALLHVPEPADSDAADDLGERLKTFAVALGRILERELLYERFRSQRLRGRASLGAMEGIMASLDAGVDLVRLVGREHADRVSAVGWPLAAPPPVFDDVLTSRERDVMALLTLGRDNGAIARHLAISTNTVKSHVRAMLRKFGAVNRTELISLYQSAHPRPLVPR